MFFFFFFPITKLLWIFLVDVFVDLYLWKRLPNFQLSIGYKTKNAWFMYDNHET